MIQMIKFLTLSCCVLFIQQCRAQELTTLKQNDDVIEEGIIGQITVFGDAPQLTPLLLKGLPGRNQLCLLEDVPDESLIVSEAGGLANVFVFLKKLPVNLQVPQLKRESSLICKECRYTPHAQIALAGQPFSLINEDFVDSNFHIYGFSNETHNYVLEPQYPGFESPTIRYRFKNSEILPVQVHSNLHPWMKAWILPLDHPYAAVTDKNGNFTIPGLPVGTYEFRVWHERVGWLEKSLPIEVLEDKPTKIQLVYPVKRFL